jgi:small ligand-binding sensory domain FIST
MPSCCFAWQAHGVIGNQDSGPVEIESMPAVSLTLAQLQGTEVRTFSLSGSSLPDAGNLPTAAWFVHGATCHHVLTKWQCIMSCQQHSMDSFHCV